MTDLLKCDFTCRVSSVLSKDTKQFGYKFMFDGLEDTCWNSDQGSPQFIVLRFQRPISPERLSIQFQGGFAGKDCVIEAENNSTRFKIHDFFPEDNNKEQHFELQNITNPVTVLKITFTNSTDFFAMAKLEVGDISPELLGHPQSYIAFLGLDVSTNAVHNAIWDSFSSSRRTEKSPLLMKLINKNYFFPVKKPKKSSFEWHVPKGILKTNWLSKHLYQLPAIAVLFYDLDWDDAAWADKLIDVVTKITSLRESLKDRNSKIALVLIQKTIPLPGSENTEATEKAAELCSICELSAKLLFALPYSDHLHGYTMRMEGAFYELAQNYYQQESKRIKNNRDMLNKTTQQLLFVRYQFKIAFFNELKQDLLQAVKNYKQAYAYLMEVRASDTNMLEVKTVGGFINYKICSLSFLLNKPLDSISQFRKHVDIFRSKIGPQEVSFEHSAWMAQQYSYFGDLFEEAVNQGLTAIQTQHPGFYYQQAAACAANQKHQCQKLCKESVSYPNPDPLENVNSMEFYGQRPWRPGVQSIEPPDLNLEKQGYHALQFKELQVHHSNLIINHLRNAVAQFKKYKCPRLKRQLMVQMGQEYHCSQENSKALALLSHVLWHYRIEKWCPLVSNILLTALKCAFLSANVQEYISLGLEAISSWIQCIAEEKIHYQSNIHNLIMGNPPFPMGNLSPEEISSSEALWIENLATIKSQPLIFTIPMPNVTQFVECKAMFTNKQFHADEKLSLKVYLRTNCTQVVKFTKLSVMFGNTLYNKPMFCEIPNEKQMLGENGNLSLLPNKTRLFTFEFLPNPSDVNRNIQITQIALQLGSEKYICAVLVWPDISQEQTVTSEEIRKEFPLINVCCMDDLNFNELIEEKSTLILPREPRLQVQISQETTVLKDEIYPLQLSIMCEERNPIYNLTVSLHLDEESENTDLNDLTEFYETLPCSDTLKCRELIGIDLGQLAPGAMVERCFYMKALSVHPRNVVFKLSYMTEVDVDEETLTCQCVKEERHTYDVKEPFHFAPQLLNLKFQLVQYARAEEQFLLRLDITSSSDLAVDLKDSSLSLTKHFVMSDEESSQVAGLELNKGEIASDCFCLLANSDSQELVPLGTYSLTWKRKSTNSTIPWVKQEFMLPNINIVKVPLYAELEAPSHGCVRTPMTISYTLHNRSTTVQELSLVVDGSDAFMYAGNKQLHFWILPRNNYKLVYNLYPLISGFVQLPKLKLLLNPGKSTAISLDDLLQEMLPSHMFIMPQEKTQTSIENGRSA